LAYEVIQPLRNKGRKRVGRSWPKKEKKRKERGVRGVKPHMTKMQGYFFHAGVGEKDDPQERSIQRKEDLHGRCGSTREGKTKVTKEVFT